jgi:hypothetical protein
MRNALLLSIVLLAGTMPVSADQPATTPPPPTKFGVQRPAQPNPYARLFETREALTQALKQAQHQSGNQAPKKTVCNGMTIIEADPFFDQKMRVTPPKDPNVRYTIRAVEPPACR